MFVDEAVVLCKAGDGGKGCHSFDRRNPHHPKPTGGDGGPGGSIVMEASPNIHTLLDFQLTRNFEAQKGANGSSSDMRGHTGADKILFVPPGTEIFDRKTGELLKDLDKAGVRVIVCKGGQGGHGNDKHRGAASGELGEEKELLLKLKLIADVGLVGFPNAGKSTLITRLSNARSKVASYPFTTKNPILGVVKFDDELSMILADIPGIVEGAHTGRGMGIEFLKHVERTKALLHIIDFASIDGRDPVSDFRALNLELDSYSQILAGKSQIVVANKMDLPEAKVNLKTFKKKIRVEVLPISAATGEGLDELKERLKKMA